jgi:hypothetical protein
MYHTTSIIKIFLIKSCCNEIFYISLSNNNNLKHLKMGKPSSKGKYVVKANLYDIYVLATSRPDTTKKHGYSMGFDFRIYKNGKLVEKGLKSKDAAVAKALTLVPKKQKA